MRHRLAALVVAFLLAPCLGRAADRTPFKVGISARTNSTLALSMAKNGKLDESQRIAPEIVAFGSERDIAITLALQRLGLMRNS